MGSNGQVGRELQTALAPIGDLLALDRHGLDLANPDVIRNSIRACKPDLIVNAAAYTTVDLAESEPTLAMAVNGIAPGVLAEETKRLNALLVHFSTDYVFDGTKKTPYTELDTPNPLSVYGKSKLAGEQAIQAVGPAHYILRTSWVFAARGSNFMNTILRLANEREELHIVNDQIGTPTWARAIAEITASMIAAHSTDRSGLYHVTARGAVTWFGFAQAILAEAHRKMGLPIPHLIPITTAEYPLPARRPANSRLDTSRLAATFSIKPAPWEEMLRRCLHERPRA